MVAKLSLNSAAFGKGLKRGAKSVGGFAKKVGMAAAKLAAAGAALGAAGGAGLVAMTRRSLASIDALGKMSDQLGIATEQLTAFQHAANITGVEQSSLSKGLQRLVRMSGELSAGSAEGKKAFDLLGMSAADLEGQLPSETLREVSERIKNMGTSQEQAAAAAALFGRQGIEMLNFLKLGREGMDAMAAESDRLGLSITRIEAAQIEQANDAMTRVRAVFQGFANQVTIKVAPVIEHLATKFHEWMEAAGGGAMVVTKAMGPVVTALGWVGNAVRAVQIAWKLLQMGATAVIGGLIFSIQKLAEGIIWVSNKLGIATAGMEEFAMTMKFAQEGLKEDLQGLVDETDALVNQDWPSTKAQKFFDDINAASKMTAETTVKNLKKIPEAMEQAVPSTEKVTKVLDQLTEKLVALKFTERQRTISDLIKEGANPDQIKKAIRLLDQIEHAQGVKRAQEFLKRQQKSEPVEIRAGEAALRGSTSEFTARLSGIRALQGGKKQEKDIEKIKEFSEEQLAEARKLNDKLANQGTIAVVDSI